MRKNIILLALALCSWTQSFSQQQVACIAFWNLENLFDTLDAPYSGDDEFTPLGINQYTPSVYREKLNHLSDVISQLGTEITPDGPALLGVCEVENRMVLEDLCRQPSIAKRRYKVIHHDSRDHRDIDVGLLYNPKYYTPVGDAILRLHLYDERGDQVYTRDILHAWGNLLGQKVHVLVNHWPSRRGGESGSAPLRKAAAYECRKVIDSLMKLDPYVRVVVMGDLNDDPVSPSVKEVLHAVGLKQAPKALKNWDPKQFSAHKDGKPWPPMVNAMYDYYQDGIGTLAYQDAWGLFDQLILTPGFIKDPNGWKFYRSHVFNKPFILQTTGTFKGYPWRTYVGNTYYGGYSDHLPVYCLVIREQPKE